ncbi:MAG: right-handed parallel beta-helix repeat-containing protein [Victivallales bacterium]|nr:right-handed parallel beta-helix repeat-containing protein [Victivallales bacterium]
MRLNRTGCCALIFMMIFISNAATGETLQDFAAPTKIDESMYGCGPMLKPGRTFYLSLKGSDDADGLSPEKAWKNFSFACEQLKAGDTLLIAEGEYEEPRGVSLNEKDNSKNYTENCGQPGRPIRIMAQDNARVIIRGGKRYVLNTATDGSNAVVQTRLGKLRNNTTVWEDGTGIQLEDAGTFEHVKELPGTYFFDEKVRCLYVHFSDGLSGLNRAVRVEHARIGMRIHGSYILIKGLWFMNYGCAILMRANYEQSKGRVCGDNKTTHVTIEDCGFFANSETGINPLAVQWCLFKNNIGGMNGKRGTMMSKYEGFTDNLIIGNHFSASPPTLRRSGNPVYFAMSHYGGVSARNKIIGNVLDDTLAFRWKPFATQSIFEGNILTGNFYQSDISTRHVTSPAMRSILRNNTILGKLGWHGESLSDADRHLDRLDSDKIFINNYVAGGDASAVKTAMFADPAYLDFRLQKNSPLRNEGVAGGCRGALSNNGRIFYAGKGADGIQQSVNALHPGDTLYIMPGKYSDKLTVAVSGTKDAPLTIRAHGREQVSFPAVEISGSHVVIEGISVFNAKNDAFSISGTHVTLKHCIAFKASGSGVMASKAENLALRNCTLADNATGITLKDSQAVSVRDSIISGGKHLSVLDASDLTASHNIYYGANGMPERDFGSIIANPLFNDSNTGDLRLAWNSPALRVEAFNSPAGALPAMTKTPLIANEKVRFIGRHSAVIYWNTPEDDTTGEVEYWIKGQEQKKRKVSSQGQGTRHVAGLNSLARDKVYEFRIIAERRRGGNALGKVHQFRTLREVPAPVTYYISPQGNDANDGLGISTAWRSLRQACAAANAGDTVLLAPGVYHDPIIPLKNGSQDKPLTFKKHGDGQVIIDGQGVFATVILLEGKININIDGISFDNLHRGRRDGLIILQSCRDIKIINCRAGGCSKIDWMSGTFFRARNSRNIILENCVSWGMDYPIVLARCRDVIIKNNTIVDSSMCGSSIWTSDNVTLVNNLWYNYAVPSKKTPALVFFDVGKCKITSDYNLVFSTTSQHRFGEVKDIRSRPLVSGVDLAEWRKLTGHDGNSIQADPLFMDYKKGDFRLKPGSPAIGKGMNGENIGATGSAVLRP